MNKKLTITCFSLSLIYLLFFLNISDITSSSLLAPTGMRDSESTELAMHLEKQDISSLDRGLIVSGNTIKNSDIINISGTPAAGASFEAQAISIMDELKSVLEQRSTGLKYVAQQVVLLKDIRNKDLCIKLMKRYYKKDFPATTFVQQPPMNGTLLGIDIAAIDPSNVSDLNIIHHSRFSTEVNYDGLEWLYLGGVESSPGIKSAFNQGKNAYDKMLKLLKQSDFGLENAVVFRNYVKDFLVPEKGDKDQNSRYYWFCESRRIYFNIDFTPTLSLSGHDGTSYPTATGIGTQGPDIVLAGKFLKTARKDVFVASFSNPYQSNPYDYRKQEEASGAIVKKTWPVPLFNRATVIIIGNKVKVEIAGTAAIKGRKSQYIGNPLAQAREIANVFAHLFSHIENELRKKNIIIKLSVEMIKQACLYIKEDDTADYLAIREFYKKKFGDSALSIVLADVCYADLLVEVDGTIETTILTGRMPINSKPAIKSQDQKPVLTAQ